MHPWWEHSNWWSTGARYHCVRLRALARHDRFELRAATLDSRLLGAWEEVVGSDRAVISRAAGNTYAIEYTSDGKTGGFEARLGQLGDHLALDVWSALRDTDVLQPYVGLLVAGHSLLALDIGPDEIRVAALEPDSLLTAFRAGQVRLAHGRLENQLILYGTTEELGSAFASYLGRSGALAAPDAWRRAGGAGATAPRRPVAVPCFEASAWREADQLFRRDPHWVGADGASSVDLGGGRTLWLFSDTWIDPSGQGTREGASHGQQQRCGPDRHGSDHGRDLLPLGESRRRESSRPLPRPRR